MRGSLLLFARPCTRPLVGMIFSTRCSLCRHRWLTRCFQVGMMNMLSSLLLIRSILYRCKLCSFFDVISCVIHLFFYSLPRKGIFKYCEKFTENENRLFLCRRIDFRKIQKRKNRMHFESSFLAFDAALMKINIKITERERRRQIVPGETYDSIDSRSNSGRNETVSRFRFRSRFMKGRAKNRSQDVSQGTQPL